MNQEFLDILEDIEIMGKTIYGEARGSTKIDRIGVGFVIFNRAVEARKFGRPHVLFGDGRIKSACLVPWQFSCWNKNDPNRKILMSADLEKDRVFRACTKIAGDIMMGRLKDDPTFGSLHYHTIAMGWPKAWGLKKVPAARLGAHLFYNDIG